MSGNWRDAAHIEELIASQTGARVTVEAIVPTGPRYPRAHVSVVHVRAPEGPGYRLILKGYRSAEALAHECTALDFAGRIPVRVPTVVAREDSPESPLGRHVALMTDMGERFLDEITPEEEPDVLGRVNQCILRLHAGSADSSRQESALPALHPDSLAADLGVLSPFLQAHGRSAVAEAAAEAVRYAAGRWAAGAASTSGFKPCLVHGDLHVSNVLLSRHEEIGLVDWAGSLWGDPALDLAYYLVRSLNLRFPAQAGLLIQQLVRWHAEDCGDPSLPDRMHFHTLTTIVRTLGLCAEWDRLDLADKTADLLDRVLSGADVW